MVGKRIRDTAVMSRSTDTDEPSPPPANNAQDVFRKYFEAQFQPLDLPLARPANDGESDEQEDSDSDGEDENSDMDSDWDGLSEADDDENEVEVIEHKEARVAPEDLIDKKARKAFMVCISYFISFSLHPNYRVLQNAKPPTSPDVPKTNTTTKQSTKEEIEDDADNLKHDLALQRLLRESHLLESASELAPTGKNRLKALDLRMQSLGAKSSLYAQSKMPTAHRRGIKAKAVAKEDRRRKEAKENGIILEKPNKVTKSNTGRRERGIVGSSIGKFSGGTLNLSKHDLHSMQSSKGRSGKSKGKGKGAKGRR
ncbi:uncharacterized protein N7459_008548 [Penicillium hispanicum]|uniref:uncharacterized protein n=1 Tax=Penicillium hispanicum TaxID=1080232 RepID=UPI0025416B96|nr:uncharacterized protein N7459_008548 [Penicillium hispanicum]KAJ5574121.1 hypothetical protein N7459_008548 [Penicillium hispanicum]